MPNEGLRWPQNETDCFQLNEIMAWYRFSTIWMKGEEKPRFRDLGKWMEIIVLRDNINKAMR